jgi:tetratricopeptide (TPR) repeat protein
MECDVANAEATVLSDRDKILEEIKQTITIPLLNQNIRNALVESAKIEVERNRNADLPIKCNSMDKYANILSFIGRYVEACPILQEVIDIQVVLYGLEHPDVIRTMNNLALLLKDTGKFEESALLHQKALQMAEKVYGPEHAETSISLNRLGTILRVLERYDEALPLLKRSLKITEICYGLEHTYTSGSLKNLANLLRQMKRYSEAEPLCRRALAIEERISGLNHLYTANRCHNMAVLLSDMERYDEAEIYFKRTLAIRDILFPGHPYNGATASKYGDMLKIMGRFSDALAVYQEALPIREKAMGPDHPFVQHIRTSIGEVQRKLTVNKIESE